VLRAVPGSGAEEVVTARAKMRNSIVAQLDHREAIKNRAGRAESSSTTFECEIRRAIRPHAIEKMPASAVKFTLTPVILNDDLISAKWIWRK